MNIVQTFDKLSEMPAGRIRIIVLGEAADTRELFEVFFDRRGLDARAVGSAVEVLRIAKQWPPALVLLDISSESRRVRELRTLASADVLRAVPFVTTLPLETDESQALARALGARLVPCRRWDLEEVLQCVTRVASSVT